MELQSFLKHFLHEDRGLLTRYFLFSGIAFLVFYVLWRRYFLRIRIQPKFPTARDISREVLYSLLSLMIFALVATSVFSLARHGYTRIYRDFHAHSVWYFVISVVAFILLHDAYFYWTHRFMHWGRIYRYVHRVHHLSSNPTPWAAFSFHPLEALIEVGILPLVVFLIPVHPFAILIWALYMTTLNVMGHLGYELFPRGFTTGIITRWHNTSVHHNMHHRYVRSNYGLYFNIWDRLMGTNHVRYEEEFEKVKSGPQGEMAESPTFKMADL